MFYNNGNIENVVVLTDSLYSASKTFMSEILYNNFDKISYVEYKESNIVNVKRLKKFKHNGSILNSNYSNTELKNEFHCRFGHPCNLFKLVLAYNNSTTVNVDHYTTITTNSLFNGSYRLFDLDLVYEGKRHYFNNYSNTILSENVMENKINSNLNDLFQKSNKKGKIDDYHREFYEKLNLCLNKIYKKDNEESCKKIINLFTRIN